MGLKLRMGPYGSEQGALMEGEPLLDQNRLISFEFISGEPNSENTSGMATTRIKKLVIIGKLNYDLDVISGKGEDPHKQLIDWVIRGEGVSAYRYVILSLVSSGQVMRQYDFPCAYVDDYEETQNEENGVGTFRLVITQKEDCVNTVEVSARFADRQV